MDPSTLLRVSVLACLATCFFATSQVEEFTVQRLNGFNPNVHISRNRVSYDQEGQQVTTLHIPCTKVLPQGEDVCWMRQEGPMDPDTALAHYREVNNPPPDSHLFTYHHKNRYRPLTKAMCTAGPEPLQGHDIRISLTLKYLLRGVPFNIMKVNSRWCSDAFILYLRKYTQILTPYIQAAPAVHNIFVHLTMPAVH